MMKFSWPSVNHELAGGSACDRPLAGEVVPYNSMLTIESESTKGVTFNVRRISLGMRMELMRKIREISRKIEFLAAGDALQERLEANLLAHEIDATYLRWGLVGISGLQIDDEQATTELLIEKGPDALSSEIVRVIKAQCGLSEEERKN